MYNNIMINETEKRHEIKWKRISNFPDYLVSNFGDVISYRRGNNRLLKPSPNTKGYLMVNLYNNDKDGKYKMNTKYLHRIVIETFIGKRDDMTTQHMDGDKHNNHISNLCYLTRSENVQHAFDSGLNEGLKGENHPGSKFTTEDILNIRSLCENGIRHSFIANKYNSNVSYISKIWRRKVWKHLK